MRKSPNETIISCGEVRGRILRGAAAGLNYLPRMVSQKPWQLESALKLVVRLVFCFAVGGLLAAAARHALGDKLVEASLLNLFLAALTFQVAALVFIAMFLREQQVGWAAAFGFKTKWPQALVVGVAVGLIALPVVWGLQWLAAELLTRAGFNLPEQEAVRLLRDAHTFGKQIFIGVVAIVLAPPVEEMFFRGILYPLIKQSGFPQLALWSVAVLFAVIHGSLPILLPLVALAVILTLLYEWTDNLLAPIIVHAIFNAANFSMMFLLDGFSKFPAQP